MELQRDKIQRLKMECRHLAQENDNLISVQHEQDLQKIIQEQKKQEQKQAFQRCTE